MANLEIDVIRAIIRKTFVVGAILWAASFLYAGSAFSVAVAVGVAVAALNLVFVAWLSKKLVGAGREGQVGKAGWTVFSLVKMAALFGIVWFLIVRVGLDAIGFVIGFSSFLPAIVWQAATSFDGDTSDPDA